MYSMLFYNGTKLFLNYHSDFYSHTLRPKMFGEVDFWLETMIIIKIFVTQEALTDVHGNEAVFLLNFSKWPTQEN